MSILCDSDLAFFRSAQEAAMPDTLNVVSYTLTSDNMGGFTAASSAGSASGRIGSTSWQSDERVLAERLGVDKPYFITLPYGTAITEKNRITYNSRTFEVISVSQGSYGTATRCICREVT